MEQPRGTAWNGLALVSAPLFAVTQTIQTLGKAVMFCRRGAFWLRCGLIVFAALSAGCRQHTTGSTASPIVPAVATTLPTTRAAGEFVQSPRRIVFDAAEAQVPIELVTFTPVVSFTSADGVRRRMTLDTGSDAVLVTPGFVAAGGLATRPSNRSHRDASGAWAGTPVATMDRLELGAVRFEDFDADVVGNDTGTQLAMIRGRN